MHETGKMRQICPHCQGNLKVTVSAPGGVSKFTRTGFDWFGFTVADAFRPRRRRLDHTAQAGTWPRDVGPASQPAAPQSNINTSELQPGESRECTRYRPKTIGDLGPSFAWSAVLGAGSGAVAWAFGAPARAVAGVASGVAGVAFLVVSAPVVWIGHANVVTMLEKLTRTDIDGDGQAGDIAVDLNADLNKGGTSTQKTKVTLPLSQVRAWRRFCQDVTAGVCNFSGNAAEEHGLERSWFDSLVEHWANPDPKLALVDPESVGPRLTLRLTPDGETLVAWHGTAPLSELAPLLEQLTGTDRQ